jgi:flagellum-specific ATP synthase
MLLYRIIKNTKKPSEGAMISTAAGMGTVIDEVLPGAVQARTTEYKRGFEEAGREFEKLLATQTREAQILAEKNAREGFKALLSAVLKKYDALEAKRRKENVLLITAILKNILAGSKTDEGQIKKSIEEALGHFAPHEDVEVYLSEADFDALAASGMAVELERSRKGISLKKDRALSKGGCIVESGSRAVDATAEEKIRNAGEKALAGVEIKEGTSLVTVEGVVKEIVGNVIEVEGLECSIGDMCDIFTKDNKKRIKSEAVGYREGKNLLMPLDEMQGVGPNSRVVDLKQQFELPLGVDMLGRVMDGLGNPIDGGPPIKATEKRSIYGVSTTPFERDRIKDKLTTGIRAIDALFTCGKGQRMGIFSGSGVGKSSLMGMMARNTSADVNVIGLIGERGREVKDFIEKDLQEEGLKRAVVIAATSDRSALERVHGAMAATTIAEFFKDMGLNVLLMMDSVTRYATALREIGLATGEPPSTKGFTPSVFTKLPKLLERSGNFVKGGSITAFYTVLVEGDDMNEPVADSVRSILDGHIVLSRKLATRNHYPAIDVTSSISRIMPDIVDAGRIRTAGEVKETVSIMQEMEDLINIGAYKKGANPKVDHARRIIEQLNLFLRQGIDEKSDPAKSMAELEDILKAEAKK